MTEPTLNKCSYCNNHLRIKFISFEPLIWQIYGNFTSTKYKGIFCSSSCCLLNEKKPVTDVRQNKLTS